MLHQNLINNGIDPMEVTKVLMSHLHKDHSGGIGIKDEILNQRFISFPNAVYYVNKDELEFGMDMNNASYHPEDFEILARADKVVFTGKKLEQKQYINYSGYPGGKKEEVAEDLLKRRPEVIMERAIKGMLPKNRLGRKMIKKLFVYAGSTHTHSAQQPKELKF